ncbi:signal peptidase I [Bacillus sp. 1780r2a1]|uniref:signal peptidase I n=1 Tax=Priestia TaxID=2800373 RepID=UPI00220EEE0C|nr:signal peptidase I [Priestia flexa]MDT2048354.1 signal peptidase I [Priestia flexa]USY55564.1 signal peptidase I [Bacillus sp. 1780r2a1]
MKEIVAWGKSILIAVAIVFLVRNFVFVPIIVDGASMMPTLESEERMIVNKLGGVDRFDIVVFHVTKNKDYIKRVIGLPGDHIEYKDDTLYINGKAYEEPYLDEYKKGLLGQPLTEDFKLEEYTGETVVPNGQLFVMGDNRRNSLDSRSPMLGTVPYDQVVGKAELAYWPLEKLEVIGSDSKE